MSNSIWENGVLKSVIHDDIYFSQDEGLLETRHVFLEGNNLPSRFANINSDFHIFETGFGTGLNFFASWQLWKELTKNTVLNFISVEKYPLPISDIEKAISIWPEFLPYLNEFKSQYPQEPTDKINIVLDGGMINLEIIFADVNDSLHNLNTKFDAWFLDGFAPAKNPDMWSDYLYENMARLTNTRGTFSTFTSVGNVRRGLIENGFAVTKAKGFGKKRHILVGVRI